MMIQTSFNAGEFSPLLEGHIDAPQRQNALRTCHNLIALKQGPVRRRNGTCFIIQVKYLALKTALLSFEFSATQAYVIEVGDCYMRFHHSLGTILASDSNLPYEISTPYTQASLWDEQGICRLRAVQSADILYLTHPDSPPLMLMRRAHNQWELQEFTPEDGPYLDQNEQLITLVPSALKGAITVTASHSIFTQTDIKRALRIGHNHQWGYGIITEYINSSTVKVELQSPLSAISPTQEWRLGAWSKTTGYPSCATFFQDRLFFSGCAGFPHRIDGSCSGDFIRFSPTDANGTLADDHALSLTLNSDTINHISWINGNEKGLLVGTVGAEWLISSGTSKPMTSSSLQAVCLSSTGSSHVACMTMGNTTAFIQRGRRKVHLMGFMFSEDGFKAPDMTLYAEHITKPGITQLAWQQEPYGILWALRQDGALLGFTYEPDQRIGAWHRHTIGGVSDEAEKIPAKVEAMAVISSVHDAAQELWLVVQRVINGQQVRYIEVMHCAQEEGSTATHAYLDSKLSYQGVPVTKVTGLEHLEGQRVGVFSKGAELHEQTVHQGSITLERACSELEVGLKYRWCLETLPNTRIDPSTGYGLELERVNHITLRLLSSLGIFYGSNYEAMDELILNHTHYDHAPELFTGDTDKLLWPAGYQPHHKIVLTHDGPYPMTILAIMAHI